MDDVRLLPAVRRRHRDARLWVMRHNITAGLAAVGRSFDSLADAASLAGVTADDLAITMEVEDMWNRA